MTNKIMNNTSDKDKKFELIAYGVTIAASMCLIAVGCSQCYKIGYAKGMNNGRNHVLDEIVNRSINKGLTMVNSDSVRYLFSAEKLAD